MIKKYQGGKKVNRHSSFLLLFPGSGPGIIDWVRHSHGENSSLPGFFLRRFLPVPQTKNNRVKTKSQAWPCYGRLWWTFSIRTFHKAEKPLQTGLNQTRLFASSSFIGYVAVIWLSYQFVWHSRDLWMRRTQRCEMQMRKVTFTNIVLNTMSVSSAPGTVKVGDKEPMISRGMKEIS